MKKKILVWDDGNVSIIVSTAYRLLKDDLAIKNAKLKISEIIGP
jgi:hypothetical protein